MSKLPKSLLSLLMTAVVAILVACTTGSPPNLVQGSPTFFPGVNGADSSHLVTLYFDGDPTTFDLGDFAVAVALLVNPGASQVEIVGFARDVFGINLTSAQISGGGVSPLQRYDLNRDGQRGTLEDFGVALAVLLQARNSPEINQICVATLGQSCNMPADAPIPGTPFGSFPQTPTPPVTNTPTPAGPMTGNCSGGSPGNFAIELEFVSNRYSAQERDLIRQAACRWEQIITGDLTDIVLTFPGGTSRCPAVIGRPVDDLLLFVGELTMPSFPSQTGLGGFCNVRFNDGSFLPQIGFIDLALNRQPLDFLQTAIHEIGHVLGIGTLWNINIESFRPLVQLGGSDPRFVGMAGVSQFQQLGGVGGVPLQVGSAGHWRSRDEDPVSNLGREVMTPTSIQGQRQSLSRVSAAALQDLGYVVNLGAADPFDFAQPQVGEPRLNPLPVDRGEDFVIPTVLYDDYPIRKSS